jgi:hypothetical protein
MTGRAAPRESVEPGRSKQLARRTRVRSETVYVAAARFFASAFAAQPKLADDLGAGHRYHAACAAACAAAGQGEDAAQFNDQERARLLQQARDWLRADLATWTKLVDKGPQAHLAVQRTLRYWQLDPDLAGLRGPAALAKLPESEQQSCRQLWADVADLLKKAAEEREQHAEFLRLVQLVFAQGLGVNDDGAMVRNRVGL